MADRSMKIHQKLLTDISDNVDPNSTEYDSFIQHMKTHVPKGILSRYPTLLGKLHAMTTKGHLSPGQYTKLKEVASDSGNIEILELIENAESRINEPLPEIRGALTEGTSQVGSSPSKRPMTQGALTEGTSQVGNSHSKRPRTKGALTEGTSRVGSSPSKRPRTKDIAENASDVLYTRRGGLGYYDTEGKTGFLLILNSTHNRNGTEKDVMRLKTFFEDKLKFDVDNPRQLETQDLSTTQLNAALEDARNRLNGMPSCKKYYCFVCAILSHGNEDGIATTDGTKSVEEIRREFNNKAIPNFAGKPKIFFVQACRGGASQDAVDADDEADDRRDRDAELTDDDEADTMIRIPTDADILLAFATTPGYRAYRRLSMGSWFISCCIEVFDEFADTPHSHLEDMLITLKERVMGMTSRKGEKQMPCVWSSLTKRLKWKPSEL